MEQMQVQREFEAHLRKQQVQTESEEKRPVHERSSSLPQLPSSKAVFLPHSASSAGSYPHAIFPSVSQSDSQLDSQSDGSQSDDSQSAVAELMGLLSVPTRPHISGSPSSALFSDSDDPSGKLHPLQHRNFPQRSPSPKFSDTEPSGTLVRFQELESPFSVQSSDNSPYGTQLQSTSSDLPERRESPPSSHSPVKELPGTLEQSERPTTSSAQLGDSDLSGFQRRRSLSSVESSGSDPSETTQPIQKSSAGLRQRIEVCLIVHLICSRADVLSDRHSHVLR